MCLDCTLPRLYWLHVVCVKDEPRRVTETFTRVMFDEHLYNWGRYVFFHFQIARIKLWSRSVANYFTGPRLHCFCPRNTLFKCVLPSLTNRTNLVSKQFNIRKGFLFLYQPEYLKPIEPASFFSNVLLKIANFIFFENASLLIKYKPPIWKDEYIRIHQPTHFNTDDSEINTYHIYSQYISAPWSSLSYNE